MSLYNMSTLKTAEQIQSRVAEMGAQISRDYQGQKPFIIGVLRGSFIFLADLVRAMDCPSEIDFIAVSSYEGMHSKGHLSLNLDIQSEISGKHVLLVEDIVDTGQTLSYLYQHLQARKPASLKTACLLSKPEALQVPLKVEYVGFEISKEFVVGYGLDLDGNYRHLPDIMQILAPTKT